MTIRPIVKLPDPILRTVSKPVERIDAELLDLLDDMAETMYDAPGIGLAGIQVGVPRRIVVFDVTWRRRRDRDGEKGADDAEDEQDNEIVEKSPVFLINPRIVAKMGEPSVYEEGCLSIPDYYADVERPGSCRVAYLDRRGKEQVLEASGLLSTCLQHEIDHLDGTLFIDHISRLKRDMVIKKFTKQSKQDTKKPRRMVG
jgi:peptide deformylase